MLESGLSGAITRIRLRKGLRQDEAARRAGVDPSNWSKWETGERHPQRRQLVKITTGLDCDEVELGLEASIQSLEYYREQAQAAGLDIEGIAPRVVDPLTQLDVDLLPLELRSPIRSVCESLRMITHQMDDLVSLIARRNVASTEPGED